MNCDYTFLMFECNLKCIEAPWLELYFVRFTERCCMFVTERLSHLGEDYVSDASIATPCMC